MACSRRAAKLSIHLKWINGGKDRKSRVGTEAESGSAKKMVRALTAAIVTNSKGTKPASPLKARSWINSEEWVEFEITLKE